MNFIKDYIQAKVDLGQKNKDIALELDITAAMVGQYRLDRGFKPSIHVAKKVYTLDGTVLHPFNENSLQHEIKEN